MFRKTRVLAAILVVVMSMTASVSYGDLVISQIGDVEWNLATNPLASPPVLFSVTLDGNNINGNEINAFSVALRFVPTFGAVGNLEAGTVTQASANSIFPAFSPLSITNPVASVFAINGTNSPAIDVTVTGPRNLFSLSFISPFNDANGIFEVYAVPEFTNYFDVAEFDGFKFTNVPAGPDVLLGTVNVTLTAVPEPSSILLVAGSAVCAVITRRSRKK